MINVNIASLNTDQSSTSAITVPGVGRELLLLDARDVPFSQGNSEPREKRGADSRSANRVAAVLRAASAKAAISILALWFRALRTDDAARLERMFCEAGQKYAVSEEFDGDTTVWVTRRVFGVLLDAASHELSAIKVGISECALRTAIRKGMVHQCT